MDSHDLVHAVDDTSIVEALSNKYLLALVASLFGFLFSMLLEWRRNRRIPRKQLSWEIYIDTRLVEIESSLAGQVLVSYSGNPVENLTSVNFKVTNTGNSVVKNQFLRFAFPERAKMLEATLDPAPEPELGVRDVSESADSHRERRFELGHMEVGQSVGFHFIADGGDWSSWTGVHPFNAEGGVDFQRRDVARVKADQEHIRPFFIYLVILLVVPFIFDVSTSPAFGIARLVCSLVLVVLLIPHLWPVARLVERLVIQYFDQGGRIINRGLLNMDGRVQIDQATFGDHARIAAAAAEGEDV